MPLKRVPKTIMRILKSKNQFWPAFTHGFTVSGLVTLFLNWSFQPQSFSYLKAAGSALLVASLFGLALGFFAKTLSGRRHYPRPEELSESAILAMGPAILLKSFGSEEGVLFVTERGFLFKPAPTAENTTAIKASWANVVQIRKTRAFGMFQNAIALELENGSHFKFSVSQGAEWITEMHRAKNQRQAA
jgi:hypothetical protein